MLTHNESALQGFSNAQWSVMLWCLAADAQKTPDAMWSHHPGCVNTKLNFKMIVSRKFWINGPSPTTVTKIKMQCFDMKCLSVSLCLYVSLSLSLSQTHAHLSAYTHIFSQENWRNGGITKACSGSTHYFGINASVIPDASPDDNSECCNKGCVSDYLDTCHA